MRDQLIAEIERIGSADEGAIWAKGKLGAKNTLVVADAKRVRPQALPLEKGQIYGRGPAHWTKPIYMA